MVSVFFSSGKTGPQLCLKFLSPFLSHFWSLIVGTGQLRTAREPAINPVVGWMVARV